MAERSRGSRKAKTIKGQRPTSRFKGVYWETQTTKWRAAIMCDGVHKRMGRFRDEVEAAQAYDDAARELFGEYARLNFPDGVDAWIEQVHRPSTTEQSFAGQTLREEFDGTLVNVAA